MMAMMTTGRRCVAVVPLALASLLVGGEWTEGDRRPDENGFDVRIRSDARIACEDLFSGLSCETASGSLLSVTLPADYGTILFYRRSDDRIERDVEPWLVCSHSCSTNRDHGHLSIICDVKGKDILGTGQMDAFLRA